MRVSLFASVVLFLFVISHVSGGGGRTALPRTMHGDWIATSAQWAGKVVPDEVTRTLKVTVKEASITVPPLFYLDGTFQTRGEPTVFAYRIDPSTKPQAIDFILKKSDEEYRQLGIYKVDEGRLTLCWQNNGKDRPNEFKTVAEPAQMLLVLKRPPPTSHGKDKVEERNSDKK